MDAPPPSAAAQTGRAAHLEAVRRRLRLCFPRRPRLADRGVGRRTFSASMRVEPAGTRRAPVESHLTPRSTHNEIAMDIGLALFWTGPVGIGIFLAGLGVLFWGASKFRKV